MLTVFRAVIPALVVSLVAQAQGSKDLMKMADQIAATVARTRGLALKKTLRKGVLSRKQIAARMMKRIEEEYKPEEIKAEERMLKGLGLLGPEVDYQETVIKLLMEQIAGFYDPFEKKLFIADWLEPKLQRATLAHEIVHALGDQHFDLRTYARPLKEEGDRQLARAALVEGDGTAAMLEFSIAEESAAAGIPMSADIGQLPEAFFTMASGLMGAGAGTMPAFEGAPEYLKTTLVFPYIQGLRFVHHVRRKNPWSAVDAIYRNPPESTEQVLHPEKYFAGEKPIRVSEAPVPSLRGWKRVRGETLGELQTRLYLETHIDAAAAARAAQGWGGDHLVAYQPPEGEGLLIAHLSVWDSDADAGEYYRAARKVLARRTGKPETKESSVAYVVKGKAFTVQRKGREVLTVLSAPHQMASKLNQELWKSWRVGSSASRPGSR